MPIEWNWIGARWWKFDFHNHTPASFDYGKGSEQRQHQGITYKDWLLNYMRSEIDCVAVTDHNSGEWIAPLQDALSELKEDGHPDYRHLYLFPGVEITVQGNVHILAILPINKTTADIDSLLGAVKYRATKGRSDGCSECSAIEVIDEIIAAGGIAIPAHVDQASGLFINFLGNTLEQVLNHSGIVAMEVTDPSSPKPAMYTDKNLKWTEVLGSDAHHSSGHPGQRYPGSHFTWIKMSNPSLDGLRLALIDGALSVHRSDKYTGTPNSHGSLAIDSITVEEAKYLGRGTPFICQFNPWLNTVIGGRGTGKSTSLEFLRLVLKRQDELPSNLGKEFSRYSQPSLTRNDEGLLRESTVLKVIFRKDGSRFKIQWTQTSKDYEIYEETSQNDWVVSEGDIAQRFPVRIYSQKQIFELAKHPQALMQVVDEAPKVDFRGWKSTWDELVSHYLSLCAQAREVQTGLQEEVVIKGQLLDVKRKLTIFEQADHKDILQTYQLRQNQANAVEKWEQGWKSYPEEVRRLADKLQIPSLDSQYFSENEEQKELHEAIAKIHSSVEAVQSEIKKLAEHLEENHKRWLTDKTDIEFYRQVQSSKEGYNNLLIRLSEADAGDPSEYAQLVSKRQALEDKLQSFIEKRSILEKHQKSAADCLSEIHHHRDKLTVLRKNFLEQTLDGNSYVQITVVPYGNMETLEEEFRSLLNCENGQFERDIGSPKSSEGLLSKLSEGQDTAIFVKVESIKQDIFSLYRHENEEILDVKDKRFIARIQGLSPEQIDRLRFWFPNDSLDVRFSLRDGEQFKPVEQGSPGQKTAALLAFILSYGSEPLIFDQPEDDLDNHLIYDLIVSQLREIKQQRQVIIATHNANIVVNGDAENVIALDIKSGQTHIVTQGSLQEHSVRSEICRIMEGGYEAFNLRYRRINAGL